MDTPQAIDATEHTPSNWHMRSCAHANTQAQYQKS